MNHLLLLIFVFVAGQTFAQESIPLFSNKKDSSDLARVTAAIKSVFDAKQTETESAKLTIRKSQIDSMFALQTSLIKKAIGFKTNYRQGKGFVDLQDIIDGKIKPFEVYKMSINDKKLKGIPSEVYECSNLTELELLNTSIKRLPKKLNKNKSLNSIYVYNNTIKNRLKLSKNLTVKKLVISSNYAANLPKTYKNFKALETLELPKNIQLKLFPDISKNKKLTKLNLSENNMTLANLKKGSHSLEEINFTKNKIKIIPASIKALPNLKKAIFNYNSIESIDPAIAELKNLESLSLYNNKLTKIPSGIFELSKLQVVDLYYNELTVVHPAIERLSNLQILYLSNNKINELPESIGNLSSLQELYVHDNKLESLPASIDRLTNLRVLRVNNNRLTKLSNSFLPLKELENLDVSRNFLYLFPTEWESFSKLQILSVLGNPWDNKDDVTRIAKILRAKGTVCHLEGWYE